MKPILFNTEMVRAILDGRKTVTRRPVKPKPAGDGSKPEPLTTRPGYWNTWGDDFAYRQSYHPGDILYVRETWRVVDWLDAVSLKFEYAADGRISDFIDFTNERLKKFQKYINRKKWCPNIFMPREAARIFLRVTDVLVEKLWDITDAAARAEGVGASNVVYYNGVLRCKFADAWNSTLKKKDLPIYGWEANPWVWVIEFEKISKEEAINHDD